jgi:basic membrane protein A and related proteins
MSKKLYVVISVLLVAVFALSACAKPTAAPTAAPTKAPVATEAPTEAPTAAPTEAPKLKICNVNDMGGVDDKSFNATAWKGVTDAEAKYGVVGSFLESEQQTDYEKNINSYLAAGDCAIIVGIGYNISAATKAAAEANPAQKFGIIDDAYDPILPNVAASVYNIDQATYLLGYLAASQTKTGILGTYVGMKFPSTANFMDGFYNGMMKYNEVHGTSVKLIGWDPAKYEGLEVGNFSDVDKGKTITLGLLDEGADIIMPVAGPVGAGTLAAVKERGALMVGVDTDWSVLYKEDSTFVLGSALKRMDFWLLNTVGTLVDGTFTGNTFVGTLENEGVGMAIGVDYKDKIDPALLAELTQLQADIIAGTIVTTYAR